MLKKLDLRPESAFLVLSKLALGTVQDCLFVTNICTSCLTGFFFPFIVVDIPGEDGASPLHFAARFRSNLRPVSQVETTDGEGETEGVTAPLTQALSAASLFGVEVNNTMSQV